MWPRTFAERLDAWNQLRDQSSHASLEQALNNVNRWWFQTPWRAYHLHWDDQTVWPDPWQLLDDNLFCSLARGLGILYTIAMLDRDDLVDIALAEVNGDNLVLVEQKKYILNWDQEQIVNINLGAINPRRTVSLEQIKQQIK